MMQFVMPERLHMYRQTWVLPSTGMTSFFMTALANQFKAAKHTALYILRTAP